MNIIPIANLTLFNKNYTFKAERIALLKIIIRAKLIIYALFILELSLLTSILHQWIKFKSMIFCPICLTHNYTKCGSYRREWKKFSFVWKAQRYKCENYKSCKKTFGIYCNTKYKDMPNPPIFIEFTFFREQIKIMDFISKSNFIVLRIEQVEDVSVVKDNNQQTLSADFIDALQFLYDNCLNEVQNRLLAGLISILLGRGGQQKVHNLLGIWPKTIRKGKDELLKKSEEVHLSEKQRKSGAGRPNIVNNEEIQDCIEKIVEDETAGSPEGGLKWIRKTSRKISEKLNYYNLKACPNTVRNTLKVLRYSLKVSAKVLSQKANHVLRDPQFIHIKAMKKEFIKKGLPVISIDGKKKEAIGNNARSGRKYSKKAEKVNDHSFVTEMLVPFGVYDIAKKMGLIYCGTNASTAVLAVEAISYWWRYIGCKLYGDASEILILCDGGGSNSHRSKLWKYQLQKYFVDVYGISVTICHYPPGTSKWNPIEHFCFSGISKNWEGEPLITYDKALNFIRNTKTKRCKKLFVVLSEKEYKTGLKVTDYQFQSMNIEYHDPKPEWNYTISPCSDKIIEKILNIDNGIIPVPENNNQFLHCGKTADYWLEHFLEYYSHGDLGYDVAYLLKNHDPIDYSYDNEFWNPRILSEVCLNAWQTKKGTQQNIRNFIDKICWNKPQYSDFSPEYFIEMYLEKYPNTYFKHRISNLISNYSPSDFKFEINKWNSSFLSKAYKALYGTDIKSSAINYRLEKIEYQI